MKQEQAEVLALQAITFITMEERALNGFLAQTGAGLNELKDQISDPHFLAGILDFMLSDESLLMAFCDHETIQPEFVVHARRALPGAENLWDG